MAKPDLAAIRAALLEWFAHAQRDLPWRRTRDAYGIWVSEVMLQQTQVDRVKGYWTLFLERFPTVADLASAQLADVLSKWKGLGYYSRAKNLHRAAQVVVERHGGALPADHAALLELPGFGRYTAGAVASIAFGLPAPIVDGNVARVFARLFEIEGAPGDKAREATLWKFAQAMVEGENPSALNQSLMELGALICTPSSPTCLLCPVRTHCRALAHGRVDELPEKKKPTARKAMTRAVAVVARGKKLLFARREETGLFGGLWELPTAEVTAKTDAPSALRGLLQKKSVEVGAHLGTVERTLTHRDLTFVAHAVQLEGEVKKLAGYAEVRWVDPAKLTDFGMSSAMEAVVEMILSS